MHEPLVSPTARPLRLLSCQVQVVGRERKAGRSALGPYACSSNQANDIYSTSSRHAILTWDRPRCRQISKASPNMAHADNLPHKVTRTHSCPRPALQLARCTRPPGSRLRQRLGLPADSRGAQSMQRAQSARTSKTAGAAIRHAKDYRGPCQRFSIAL
jgi:hypothetical protein